MTTDLIRRLQEADEGISGIGPPGWLAERVRQAQEEVKSWPEWMRANTDHQILKARQKEE